MYMDGGNIYGGLSLFMLMFIILYDKLEFRISFGLYVDDKLL